MKSLPQAVLNRGLRHQSSFARHGPQLRSDPLLAVMNGVQRRDIVDAWRRNPNFSQVARQLRLDRRTVKRWVKRWQSTGTVRAGKSTGRKRVVGASAAEAALDLLVSGDQVTSGQVAQALHTGGLVPRLVHKSTIIRHAKAVAKQQGEPIHPVRSAPVKGLGEGSRCKRVCFARSNKARCWSNVMFTDRKRFLFSYPGVPVKGVQWVRRGQQRQALRVNHPQSVNVYAGITKYGVTSCHLVAGTTGMRSAFITKRGQPSKSITGSEYKFVLEHTLLPDGARIFSGHGISTWHLQQDNDPAHVRAAPDVVASYNNKRGTHISLLQHWPPNSPDLSPIENVWAYVQAKVNARGCKTFLEFQQAVLDEVQGVPSKMLSNLYSSMPRRMAQCLEAQGGKLKY